MAIKGHSAGNLSQKGLGIRGIILRETVLRASFRIPEQGLSASQLRDIVEKTATECGAKGELLAALTNYLPSLYVDVLAAKLDATEADILLLSAQPQYRIWTGGKKRIVSDISQYEKRKQEYLFWIDKDDKTHESPRNPGNKIGHEAIDLLIYLVERLGRRVPPAEILEQIFEDKPVDDKLDQYHKNKIEVQLTALQKFSGGEFRKYLFADKFKRGLGLKSSFADKYFIFSQLC